MERRIIFCSTCNAKYDVSRVGPGSRFLCKNCRTTIKVPDYFPERSDPDGFDPHGSAEPVAEITADLIIGGAYDDELKGLSFTKMVATGNDFVLVDCTTETLNDPPSAARVLCDRRYGVGSDGLLLVVPSKTASVGMKFYNPDGSEAEMCGNGLRCLAKYAFQHGIVRDRIMDVETRAGLRLAEIHLCGDAVSSVRIGLGTAILDPAEIPVVASPPLPARVLVEAAGERFEGTAVSMGNPHFVVFVPDADAFDVGRYGPAIENAGIFPRRTNVEFVQVHSDSVVTQRTWERGAGETFACGTGAGAVCVVCSMLGKTGPRITVRLRGGDLQVERTASGEVFLEGPAEELFTGLWCAA